VPFSVGFQKLIICKILYFAKINAKFYNSLQELMQNVVIVCKN